MRWDVFWLQSGSSRFHIHTLPCRRGVWPFAAFVKKETGRGRGGLMDFPDSDLCSQRCRVVAWWDPLIFHSFYLCLAHEIATYKKPVPTLHEVPVDIPIPFYHQPFKWKDRFQYRSTEQENSWAIIRLEVDSCKVVCFCLFVWHQNWFSDFYFLEKIWLWKHRKTSIHVKIFRVEQRWTDMFRIIVCLRSSQQLLCRQNCIEICV